MYLLVFFFRLSRRIVTVITNDIVNVWVCGSCNYIHKLYVGTYTRQKTVERRHSFTKLTINYVKCLLKRETLHFTSILESATFLNKIGYKSDFKKGKIKVPRY